MTPGGGQAGAPTGSTATSGVLRFGTGVGLINEERIDAPCRQFPADLMPFQWLASVIDEKDSQSIRKALLSISRKGVSLGFSKGLCSTSPEIVLSRLTSDLPGVLSKVAPSNYFLSRNEKFSSILSFGHGFPSTSTYG